MPSGSTMKYFVRVERLAGAEQLAGELGPDELRAGAARAVADQTALRTMPLRVLLRSAQRAVMNAQLGSVSPLGNVKSRSTKSPSTGGG